MSSDRKRGRPIEHPDSPVHAYWREKTRRYRAKKRLQKKMVEDSKEDVENEKNK